MTQRTVNELQLETTHTHRVTWPAASDRVLRTLCVSLLESNVRTTLTTLMLGFVHQLSFSWCSRDFLLYFESLLLQVSVILVFPPSLIHLTNPEKVHLFTITLYDADTPRCTELVCFASLTQRQRLHSLPRQCCRSLFFPSTWFYGCYFLHFELIVLCLFFFTFSFFTMNMFCGFSDLTFLHISWINCCSSLFFLVVHFVLFICVLSS